MSLCIFNSEFKQVLRELLRRRLFKRSRWFLQYAYLPMYSPILCSKCQLDHLVTDPESGEVVCSICGLIVQENMEDTKLQYYEKGIDTRGKEPSSLAHYDMGLSTIIGKTDIDAKGQRIQPSGLSAIQNLRNWDHRIQLHNSRDMNMKRAFNTLNRLKDKLRLSDVTIEKVAYIYRKALLKQLTIMARPFL